MLLSYTFYNQECAIPNSHCALQYNLALPLLYPDEPCIWSEIPDNKSTNLLYICEYMIPYSADHQSSNSSSLSDMQVVRSIDNPFLCHIQLHHNHHHYHDISHLHHSDIHVHSCHQNTPALKVQLWLIKLIELDKYFWLRRKVCESKSKNVLTKHIYELSSLFSCSVSF